MSDFAPGASFSIKLSPAGAFVNSIKVGDFNGDGIQDVLIVEQVSTGIAPAATLVLEGDGNGNFSDQTASVLGPAGFFAVGGGGRDFVADFNGDGVSDVLELNFGNDAPPFSGGVSSLLLSNSASRTLYDASANLGFGVAGSHSASIGDVNGDGKPDILVNTLDRGNFLLVNNGAGGFSVTPLGLPKEDGATATNTASGLIDVNGDGKADIILGQWDNVASAPSEVLLNPGNGNFSGVTPILLPASPLQNAVVLDVKSIDLNGDGRPDLILSETTGGAGSANYYQTPFIQFLINDGGGQFHDVTQTALPQALVGTSGDWYQTLTVADFNGDGHPDILASGGAGSVVYINRGDGTFFADQTFAGNAAVADVNGDGKPDVLSVNQGAGIVTVNLNSFAAGAGQPTAGDDNLSANATNTEIHAGAGNDTVNGGTAPDYLRGDDGDDSLHGGTGFDDINGNKGNDTIEGDTTVGSDWLVGGQGNDSITAHLGGNLLYGNLGNDTLHGGSGHDVVRGGQGDDVLVAGSGDQFLSGDRGDDTVTAGSGHDTIHSSQDAGIDRILSYDPGRDIVELDPGVSYTVSQVGADTVITMTGSPGNNEVILVGVQMSSLTGNWIFEG